MSVIRPMVLAAILAMTTGSASLASAPADAEPGAASLPTLEDAVLHFPLTEERLQVFRDVAAHRRSLRLEVLPGFPVAPNLDEAVAELGQDAGTVERLGRGSLSARDYVLTGLALIIAHDPDDWGLAERRLTVEMRRNVAFVRLHRESIDALLRS
jgi:hypothetical protein